MIPVGVVDLILGHLGTNNTEVKVLKSNDHTSGSLEDNVEVHPDDQIIASADGTQPETIPEMVEFKTKLWYDDQLLKKFSGDHHRTKSWIAIVFSLAKLRLNHPTLEMKVDLVLDEEIKHVKGRKIKGDIPSLKMIRDEIKPMSHHSYVVFDPSNDNYQGYAFRSEGCDELNGLAISIAEYQEDDYGNSVHLTANTLAHEIGHSLGMK